MSTQEMIKVRVVAYDFNGNAVSSTELFDAPADAEGPDFLELAEDAPTTEHSNLPAVWISVLDESGEEITGCDC